MKKTVLLVDDEEIVRDIAGEIFEVLGYSIISAGTGSEALAIFNERRDDLILIFIDMTLPDYKGSELYNKMKEISPDTKYLLTSGYKPDFDSNISDEFFIQKPYTIAELDEKLKRILPK